MSELREDVFTGGWAVIAPGRHGIGGTRPPGLPEPRGACPFCPGHEADTETAVLAIGDPWQVRVVRNRFPVARDQPDRPGHPDAHPARGAHEVLIEARDHDADLATYDDAHATLVVRAMRDRVRALESMPGIMAVSTFRNRGRRAGSSQPHPHAQIVALDVVPPAAAARRAIQLRGGVLERAISRERSEGARIVTDGDGFVTWCPYASHRAWESRIAPDFDCARFSELGDAQIAVLARRLVDIVDRLHRVLGELDYNVLVRDPPVGERDAFFTIDVLPRTGGDAGFELQSGMGICVVAPEDAAGKLRGA